MLIETNYSHDQGQTQYEIKLTPPVSYSPRGFVPLKNEHTFPIAVTAVKNILCGGREFVYQIITSETLVTRMTLPDLTTPPVSPPAKFLKGFQFICFPPHAMPPADLI